MSTVPVPTNSASIPSTWPPLAESADNSYPTRDGRPMGETDLHRKVINDLIETLTCFYEGQKVYVSGNLLLFYRPGNKRRHVSPDVLVTKGLEMKLRKNYLLWEEVLPPNVVMEITSETTRDEDIADKFEIYRDEIRVAEYFLFDPYKEYLKPQLQGWRLLGGTYVQVEAVDERLPSEQLGLHLETDGSFLRLFDPATNKRLLTPQERRKESAEEARKAEKAQQRAQAEVDRLRKELAELKRKKS